MKKFFGNASEDDAIDLDNPPDNIKERLEPSDIVREKLELRLVFSPSTATRLNTLKRLVGAKDRGDTIRRALAIYDTLVMVQLDGDEIYVQRKDGSKESVDVIGDD